MAGPSCPTDNIAMIHARTSIDLVKLIQSDGLSPPESVSQVSKIVLDLRAFELRGLEHIHDIKRATGVISSSQERQGKHELDGGALLVHGAQPGID